MYNFSKAVSEWSRPPFDNHGYISSNTILKMSSDEIIRFVRKFEIVRYDVNGWRNHKNLWREYLGLDSTKDKHILDFGCGFGIEALQFLYKGNEVSIADISEDNLEAASRMLKVMGYNPKQIVLVDGEWPFLESKPFDIFYANGVLHHTPKIKEILIRAKELLKEGGEVRLLLYSDRAWNRVLKKKKLSNELPDYQEPISEHPYFKNFVRAMDGVGNYADWYNYEKIKWISDGIFNVSFFGYICPNKQYCVVILKE